MSKVGQKPIKLPDAVKVAIGNEVKVSGPLGELSIRLPKGISVENQDGYLIVKRKNENKETKSFHGLVRSLIANMVEGVTQGFRKQLELSGIGFKASLQGQKLFLTVGYSHPVEVEPPEGIKFEVSDNKISVYGIDKELVGRTARKIRDIRPPDAYKGKGIRFEGESIRLKPGKAAKAGVKAG